GPAAAAPRSASSTRPADRRARRRRLGWPPLLAPLEGPLDAAGMDRQAIVAPDPFGQRRGRLRRVVVSAPDEEGDHLVGELVGPPRAGASGYLPQQAMASEGGSGLVERRPGEPELASRLDDREAIDPDAPQHLVLDLHQVAGIEEVAVAERGVGDT